MGEKETVMIKCGVRSWGVGSVTRKEHVIIPNLKKSGGNSVAKQISEECIIASGGLLEICTDICFRKLLVVGNESENI